MKRKILSIILSAVAVTSMSVQNLAVCAEDKIIEETIKIMPIGDSITHGYQSSGGYRKYFHHFISQDFNVDMVGPNSDYPETFTWLKEETPYDTNHCGYSGYAIQYMNGTETRQGILETLQDGDMLQTYDPDIVMLQIGTNDILSNYNDGITDRLENLINYIDENTKDDAVIFVSTIPDIDVPAVYDWFWSYGDEKYQNTVEDFADIVQGYIDSYNESIPLLVNKLQDEGKNVEFADIYKAVSNDDNIMTIEKDKYLEDGVHPNEKGYARIGMNWSNAIYKYLLFKTVDAEIECPYRVSDLVSLSNYILGRTSHNITEENFSLYDINGDGVLNSFDLVLLRQLFIEKNMQTETVKPSDSASSSTVNKALATEILEIDEDGNIIS